MIQLQVLNYLLNSGDTSMLVLNNIDKTFFDEYPEEFRFISEHFTSTSKIPDKETFVNKFPNFDFIVVNEPVDYLIDELFKDRTLKVLADKYNKMRKAAISGDTEKAVEIALSAEEFAIKAKHLNSVDLLEDTSRYEAYVERCNDFGKYYVRTGFPELDQIIGGWDRKEELATIAAKTNMGKTWILLKCLTEAAKQGLRVGIYSGEMSDRKVGYRIDTLISHISNKALVRGNIEVQNDYKRFIDDIKKEFPDTAVIKVLTPAMIGGTAGVTALRAFIEKENLDILFVDQHSLLEDDRGAKNPVEKASNISKDLKNLQVLKQIPIIAVSQQNRAPADTGSKNDNIAQAYRIVQDSTVVLFFEQKDGIMELDLSKSRDSERDKTIKYAINLDRGIFQYIPEEDNALDGQGVEQLVQEYETEPALF